MNEERFEQIEGIFHQAVHLKGEARRTFLERSCEGNTELRREVELLLAHDVDAGVDANPNYIDQIPALLAHAAAPDPEGGAVDEEMIPSKPLPERIGRYRILERLGEGGMGRVYLAEQDDPRRRVALKLLRPDLVSSGLHRRFQFEAAVLGRLQHPGIAQIYEAGRTDTESGSLPYFAMEYVAGRTLKRYVKESDLGIRARLALVAHVCDAVHHAHLNGVVHRDLKPENVLVVDRTPATAHGAGQEFANLGQPKVLDFGIARATDADVQMTTLHADVGKLMGTVTYMSPEQVRGESHRIDMRSDIYALGTLLYELLTGHPPFDLRHKPIPEAARIIQEEEPTRLGSVNTVFRGDIETIVSKALEKEPERRYDSAADLGADIRRYLANEPILAHPPSTFYELRKFARRHRGWVAGLSLSFLILVIGITSSLILLLRATRNEETALRTAYQLKITTAQACADAEPLQTLEHLESVPTHRRGWEWHHYAARIFSHLAEQTGDRCRRYTSTLACHGDGSFVTALNRAGAIEIVDLLTGQVNAVVRGEGDLEILCLSADATLVSAWCSREKKASLWDLEHQTCLQEVPLDCNEPTCCIHPSHSLWALKAGRQALTVIDRQTGIPSWQIEFTGGARYKLAFSPRGQRIALEIKSELHVFSKDGEILTADKPRDALSALAFSPDGTRIALGHIHRSISILDASTLELQQVLHGHSGEVTSVAFSPDGRYLASAAQDSTVRIWDLAGARTIRVLLTPPEYNIESLMFSGDGTLLAAGNAAHARAWRWQQDSRRVLKGHGSNAYHVSFSPEGTILASAGLIDNVRLWDPLTQENLATYPTIYAREGVGFCANGSRFIYCSDTTDFLGACHFSIVDTGAGVQLTSPKLSGDDMLFEILHKDPDMLQIAANTKYTPIVGETNASNVDRSLIADANEKKEIHLLDPVTRKTIKRIGRHDAKLCSVAFSPDASLIASGDATGTIKVWDVDSGAELAVLSDHIGKVYSICFSPDGERIASGGNDGNIMLWDTITFERVAVMREHTSYVHSVCFSPDGTMLTSASGDGTVRIWDTVLPAERWKQVQEMETLRSEAVPLVNQLLDEYKDPLDVADHLRAHKKLDAAQRLAALRVLLKTTKE